MPRLDRGRTYLENPVIQGSIAKAGLSVTPATGVTVAAQTEEMPVTRKIKMTLSAFVVTMTAANDYGGTKLCDLPNTGILILGTVVDLTCTLSGFASDVMTAHDFAVGSAVASSTALATTESNLIPSTAGVGGGASGTAKAQPTDAESKVYLPSGASNALFLNGEQLVTSGSGTATFAGTVEVTYIDLGKPA